MHGVPVCECKAATKPRWILDGVRVLICERCGKCVRGYEQLWLQRDRELERLTQDGK